MAKVNSAQQDRANYMARARTRIEATNLTKKLIAYVTATPDEAEQIMSQSQVNAAFALLKKVLPDIASQTVKVEVKTDAPTREMTLEELMTQWETLRPKSVSLPGTPHLNA